MYMWVKPEEVCEKEEHGGYPRKGDGTNERQKVASGSSALSTDVVLVVINVILVSITTSTVNCQ